MLLLLFVFFVVVSSGALFLICNLLDFPSWWCGELPLVGLRVFHSLDCWTVGQLFSRCIAVVSAIAVASAAGVNASGVQPAC